MIKKYAKVIGHPNLIRDLETNAIINTDTIESNNYDRSRKNRQKKSEEFEIIKSEIVTLKSDIDQIKTLLGDLINESRRNKT